MSDTPESLAYTLEWCAGQGRIEGLHPAKVKKAAALLREQAKQIAEMEKILAANKPTVLFDEREGPTPYTTARRFTFIATLPQGYQIETHHDTYAPYPIEVEARRAVAMFAEQFKEALLPLTAQAIESRSAETERLGPTDESAVSTGDAP